MDVEDIKRFKEDVLCEMNKVIVGQQSVIVSMLEGLLAGGHVLLEGVPGTAKTLMVRALGHVLGLKFSRIQFTPDLMPSDVTGTTVFDQKTGEFKLEKGPIFTQFLLADEINRTPPKTQSALLEVMQEGQVTLDKTTYDLEAHFMTFATQNPIEYEGTYPLAEAQIDRFYLKINVGYPSFDEEVSIISRGAHNRNVSFNELGLKTVSNSRQIVEFQELINKFTVRPELAEYLGKIIRKCREYPGVRLGVSPRGGVQCMMVSRAHAALEGRVYVIPDDIQNMARAALSHRLLLSAEAQIQGDTGERIIEKIIKSVDIPR